MQSLGWPVVLVGVQCQAFISPVGSHSPCLAALGPCQSWVADRKGTVELSRTDWGQDTSPWGLFLGTEPLNSEKAPEKTSVLE